MRLLIIFLSTLLCGSCKETSSNNTSNKKSIEVIDNVDWLIGHWKRTNDKEGKTTYEHWKKKSKTEYTGIGYTLQNNDTIWKEDIRIVKIDSIWNFEVVGVNESKSTIFTFTNLGSKSFSCQNEDNEFPKKIEYFMGKDKLKAIISGGGMEIPFEFDRMMSK